MNAASPKPTPIAKTLIEFGPLLAFFLVYARWGIFAATGVFMATSILSLGISWARERKLPAMPLVSAVLVLVLGGLTIWLHDETFIKLKLTVINGLFALVLSGGLLFGWPVLRPLLGSAIRLTDQGWRRFTWCWIGYFAFVACLNEIVWRNVSTDLWVKFKVFGILPLTFVFLLATMPVIRPFELRDEDGRRE